MKAIHPRYKPVTVTCVGCGTKIETRSTKGKDFTIDVCSHCHPFYTGRQKFVDSAGRVERFQKKWAAATPRREAAAARKAEAAADAVAAKPDPAAEKASVKPEKAAAKAEKKPDTEMAAEKVAPVPPAEKQ